MRQLTYVKHRKLKWWDVPEPQLQTPQGALVRPFIAARCDGDSVFLRHDFRNLLRLGAALHLVDPAFATDRDDIFHGPFAYGHECVAEVTAVGEAVDWSDAPAILRERATKVVISRPRVMS